MRSVPVPPQGISRTNFDAIRLLIEYVEPKSLTLAARQVKPHSPRQIKKLAAGIDRVGFLVPMLIDEANRVVSGNGRLSAALMLGLESVPVIRVTHLTAEQLQLFSIFENRITSESELDEDVVQLVLEEVSIAAPELTLTDSGYEVAEIDRMNGLHLVREYDDLDEVPDPKPQPITRLGDLWKLGRHFVICGDSTDPSVISLLVGSREVRAVIADSPYNLRIPGVVSGKGANQHQDFQFASGEMSEEQFIAFLARFLEAAKGNLVDGALAFVFMDYRHIAELLAAGREAGLSYKQLLVWVKSNGGMGSPYRNAHELIALFKHGDGPSVDNVQMGKFGRSRTNVLHFPGANVPTKGRRRALEIHPTVKPAALIAELILDVTNPGDLILDSFGGSGTTLMAANATGRDTCLCEIDPGYVDATIDRFRRKTGIDAVLVSTGQTFTEVSEERTAGLPAADVGADADQEESHGEA